jgi:hypothetical protein
MSVTVIDSFGIYCQEVIIPALKEDAANGRWKRIAPSSFLTEKGQNYYVIFVDYVVENMLVLRLSLCGVLEKNDTFVINCKCQFTNSVPDEEQRIEAIISNCYQEFVNMGFGASVGSNGLCVWASLSEEEGQYVVDGIEDPYDLYSTFIDIIETATKTL